MWRVVKTASAGILLTGVLSFAVVESSQAGASPNTIMVSSQPALPNGAAAEGAVASTMTIRGDVGLIPRDGAELQSVAADASTPGNPDYHHFLTLGAFNASYAPSGQTVAQVETFLRSGGLRVESVSADNLLVSFTGSAAQAESTFHTALENYRLADGRQVYANTSSLYAPISVADSIQTVAGLSDLVVPQGQPLAHVTKASAEKTGPRITPPSGAADACPAAATIASDFGGLTATDVASSYGLDPLYGAGDFGAGQKVDILDLFGYTKSDIAGFDDCYFGKTEGGVVLGNLSSTDVDGGAQEGNGTGSAVEDTIDIEAVAAYAPQSKIDLVEAPNTDSGFLDAIAAMADDTASQVESISYGQCETDLLAEEPGFAQLENTLFEQGAAEGKTVFASSADNGSDTCSNDSGQAVAPILSDSDPASQPYVTGVGGTAITADTDPPEEEVWNDGSSGEAGGGGISDLWREPTWQALSGVSGMSNGTIIGEAQKVMGNSFCQGAKSGGAPCREVPDVSAQASPVTGGFPTFTDGVWQIWGGTSLSSPTWAGILATINSTPTCMAGGGVGFVSPALYAIASVPSEYAASFNDITLGNNDNFGAADGLYPATTGYDMASGLGSPKVTGPGGAPGLGSYLCAPPAAAAPRVTNLSPSAIGASSLQKGATLTVDGQGFSANKTSDVEGVSIGSVSVPMSAVTVESPTSLVINPVPLALLQVASHRTGDSAGDGLGTYDVTVTTDGDATSSPGPHSTLVLYPTSSGGAARPEVDGTEPSGGVESGGSTVTIYGSGFAQGTVTQVTFGGVEAASFTVVDDNKITAVTPPYTSGTTDCLKADVPAIGVCQAQVQVTTSSGQSVEGTIPPEYSGPVTYPTSITGLYPAPTEFDFEPTPHITSIGYTTAPDLASEEGGTTVDINGTGLGWIGLGWVNVGDYQASTSEQYPSSATSTELVLSMPYQALTNRPLSVPVTVQTFGSPNMSPGGTLPGTAPSNTVDVTYAPTPYVSGVSDGSTPLAGPTSGGTAMTIHGSGFDGAESVELVDDPYGWRLTQDTITEKSNDVITFDTPAGRSGIYNVVVCGVSACSAPSEQTFTQYEPGNPSLSSISPSSGTAGTKVVIQGDNLGYLTAVYFGSVRATKFSNEPGSNQGGSPYEVTATAPAGTAGSTVDITVETTESRATGYGKSPVNDNVTFTYSS
jgi:hypothetical protein